MKSLWKSASLIALATAFAPAMALAQDEPEGAAGGSLVDELVITAQKREQNLQDVPIVVTTVGQQALQDAGVRDVKDLMLVTPGLMVSSTANESSTVARIRGIGTIGDNAGLESSVGIVIDGVYRPRASTGIGDLGELQRVEVLKGPQGTLFGKNTSAGVINVISADPSFEFGARGELTVGNYNAREISGSITGPILEDKIAGRLYLASRQRDGFYDVRIGNGPRTQTDDMERNYWTARGQLLFTPSEDLKVRVIADYTSRDESCCAATTYVRGPGAGSLDLAAGQTATLNPVRRGSRIGYANRTGDNSVIDQGLSAEATWDTPWLNNATLTSVTAWRNWRTEIAQDADFSVADLIYRRPDGSFSTEFDQFSQEFRLAGEAGPVNWMVGLFYADETLDQHTPLVFGNDLEEFLSYRFSANTNAGRLADLAAVTPGTVFIPGEGYDDSYHQEARSLAFFSNNDWEINEALTLTVGLRYTSEKKTLEAHYDNIGTSSDACFAANARRAIITGQLGAAGAASYFGTVCGAFNDYAFDDATTNQSNSNDELTGTVKLAWRIADGILTYGSYAKSYKSGGFNFDRARAAIGTISEDTFFKPEYVEAYELGVKTTLLDGNLLLNAAAFYQEFENFQLNTYDGLRYAVSSIPLVISKGVDADMNWRTPLEGLSIQAGVTFANSQYGDFTPAAGVPVRLPGSRLSGAPLWSSTLAATYVRPIGETLELRTAFNMRYSSAYNTGSDLNPIKAQGDYHIYNLRVGLGSQDERWMVELWGANLTDVAYAQVIFDASFQTGTYNAIYAPPRTYGATLRVSF
ncbi:MAG: TonB-dependent receptor [Caulobacter sp.]|nr:TonB-dependent receptor [Caulobacter sp.]